jgi:hypothetical protein
MANGHGLFEEVQRMFDDEAIPQTVSNRLIMAAIINERKDRLAHDEEIKEHLEKHCEEIENLKFQDKRWAGINTLLVAVGTVIAALIGVGSKP